MKKNEFSIPPFYESDVVTTLKQQRQQYDRMRKDLAPYVFDFGAVRFYLPRSFGFCFGVENAIDIIYKILAQANGKKVYVLSELIHNEQVNQDLRRRNVHFLMDTFGNHLIPFSSLRADDIVIIPAFGTTLEIESQLLKIGVNIEKYNTTCPFVKKVWKASEVLLEKGYTIIIHGKYYHEETRATLSHAKKNGTPCLIIRDLAEAELLAKYITKAYPPEQFFQDFKEKHTENFNPTRDLERIGLVNQTTMLATETESIGLFLKNVYIQYYNLTKENLTTRFADTRDTLCYATNHNQSALAYTLRNVSLDVALVVGGYKSSNTTNLYRFCTEYMPSYFIESEEKIRAINEIQHFDYLLKKESISIIPPLLTPEKVTNILIILGASCPDILVERVMRKIMLYTLSETDFTTRLQEIKEMYLQSFR